MKIKIGVIGAGKMGQNHVRILYGMDDIFELIGIYDPDSSKKDISKKYKIKFFENCDELLNCVQAVIISCPTSLHKQMALKAAEKCVHALIEKPIAENAIEAKKIKDEFIERHLVLAIGHVERFNPAVTKLVETADGMNIQAVEMHRCGPFFNRINDVDVVSDLMVHDIDILVNSITKDFPVDINAKGKFSHEKPFVDYACAVITFKEGIIATLTSSRTTENRIRQISIHAKEAYIVSDLLTQEITVYRNGGVECEKIKADQFNALKSELLDFSESINKGQNPTVDGSDAIRSMQVHDIIRKEIYEHLEACNESTIS